MFIGLRRFTNLSTIRGTPSALVTLKPNAIMRLKELYSKTDNGILKIGLKSKGCTGMAYDLNYVEKKSPQDEEIKQDDVIILIDSRALISIIGTEIDFVKDDISEQFTFSNPNVKEACGCGQSFIV